MPLILSCRKHDLFYSPFSLFPHFFCFPSTTATFLLFYHHHHRHHISIVFFPPPPPTPLFYCFLSSSTTTSTSFLLFSLHYHRQLVFYCFPFNHHHHFTISSYFQLNFVCINPLGPIVPKVDNAFHWVNHYELDNEIGFTYNIYPLDSELSGG